MDILKCIPWAHFLKTFTRSVQVGEEGPKMLSRGFEYVSCGRVWDVVVKKLSLASNFLEKYRDCPLQRKILGGFRYIMVINGLHISCLLLLLIWCYARGEMRNINYVELEKCNWNGQEKFISFKHILID